MTAYYNEFDKDKAAWLRELIKAGVIAPGDVDERSIKDVRASDLVGYTQCHWFAGIGVWSYALRLAGWPDDREVWTGSCPCPGFSCAGKGGGFNDPRHLWPDWYPLIGERRPPVIFGEQADDAIGFGWLDLVCGNLEASSYAVAAAVLGAHSSGAPHIRQRLYFCADSSSERFQERDRQRICTVGSRNAESEHCSVTGQRSDADSRGQEAGRLDGQHSERCSRSRESDSSDGAATPEFCATGGSQPIRPWRGPGWLDPLTARSVAEAGATRGYWADCDWWYGRDEKYRPIGPGLFPLASRSAARVLRLRGYGDSIVAPVAQAFIQAYMSIDNSTNEQVQSLIDQLDEVLTKEERAE